MTDQGLDQQTKPSISAMFPCYNDAGTIASMVIVTIITLEKLTSNFEVIVVDDGSSDHSRELLKRLEKDYPQLKLVFHPHNRGYGGALRSGFQAATKDFIFYTDGDAQYDVRELEKLVQCLNKDVDVVQGYKEKRHDPMYRIVIGKIYQYLMKWAFGLKIKDVDCDFRLIRRSVFNTVQLKEDSGVICVEMVKKIQDAGFRFVEVSVHHFFRAYGHSQFFNYRRLARVAVNIIRLWWELVLWPRIRTIFSGKGRIPTNSPK